MEKKKKITLQYFTLGATCVHLYEQRLNKTGWKKNHAVSYSQPATRHIQCNILFCSPLDVNRFRFLFRRTTVVRWTLQYYRCLNKRKFFSVYKLYV